MLLVFCAKILHYLWWWLIICGSPQLVYCVCAALIQLLRECQNWKNWHSFRGKKSPFPRLKTLKLALCPELREFPNRPPSSLETVEFEAYPRLKLLPQCKFSSSLKLLSIEGFPLLKAWYETEGREHLTNIAHLLLVIQTGWF
jgi:hypothetical protein